MPASSATAARSRRRARLRSTAVPKRRPMAYATRGGSSDPSVRKRSETGPARCRRAPARASNVARSRTRQIRPRGASGRGPGARAALHGPPWCASGGGSRGSWRACGCSAGTCASTMASSRRPRAARGRGPRGRRKPTQCTSPARSDATRSARSKSGETPAAPCRTRMPVLRCAPRPARGRPSRLPRCVTARTRPTRAPRAGRSPHLWTLLWTTRTVDRRADHPLTVVARRTVSVDGRRIWDQGSATLRDQLAPATWAAWFHGRAPARLRRRHARSWACPSSLAAERIRSSYSGMLTDAIRDSTGVTRPRRAPRRHRAEGARVARSAPPPVAVGRSTTSDRVDPLDCERRSTHADDDGRRPPGPRAR